MEKHAKIFVAGHRGLVGSAIIRALNSEGYNQIITRTRQELNLLDPQAVLAFFASNTPEYVVIAAAKVGGILANNCYPVEFLSENLTIQNNIILAAQKYNVKKLLFLGSSCIYPKFAPQPIPETALLTGLLEPTNDAYALAKIAGIKLCDAMNRQYGTNFISAMPTNMYGPGDNFDLQNSHVLPAMIRKLHLCKLALNGDWKAISRDQNRFGTIPKDFLTLLESDHPQVVLWGSGTPMREFLYSDDLAKACVFLLQNVDAHQLDPHPLDDQNPCALVNVGYGSDLTIKELAFIIQKIVGYEGEVVWDSTKPDGTPKKLMDSSKLFALGWKPTISLEEGVKRAYQWYLDNL
jgi:GDP-L-fucose synthase